VLTAGRAVLLLWYVLVEQVTRIADEIEYELNERRDRVRSRKRDIELARAGRDATPRGSA
jgi:hypothetical protein